MELSAEEGRRLEEPSGYADCLGRWHFSESQRLQLRRLLARWVALGGGVLDLGDFDEGASSRALLRSLTERVEALPIRWGSP